MKEQIETTDSNYNTIVMDYDKNNYDINAGKLECGQSVVCPHNSDMKVGKDENGDVILTMKAFSKNCFIT